MKMYTMDESDVEMWKNGGETLYRAEDFIN